MNSQFAASSVSNSNASVKGPFKVNEGAVLRHPDAYKDGNGIFKREAMVADYNRAMSPSPFLGLQGEDGVERKALMYYQVLMAPKGCKTEEEIKEAIRNAYQSEKKIQEFKGNKRDLLCAFSLAFDGYLAIKNAASKAKVAVMLITLVQAYRDACLKREINNNNDELSVEEQKTKHRLMPNIGGLLDKTWQHAGVLYALEGDCSQVSSVFEGIISDACEGGSALGKLWQMVEGFFNDNSLAQKSYGDELMEQYILNEPKKAVEALRVLMKDHSEEPEVAIWYWLAVAVQSIPAKGNKGERSVFWRAVYELKKVKFLKVREEEDLREAYYQSKNSEGEVHKGVGEYSPEELDNFFNKCDGLMVFSEKNQPMVFSNKGMLVVEGKKGMKVFDEEMKGVEKILVE